MNNAARSSVILRRSRFDGVIFDLDGVVTRTAQVHAAAWKQLFDEYREERVRRHLPAYAPFDIDRDYRLYVDGKLRYDGIQSFLESCGIGIPYGQPEDSPEQETVCGLANRKNNLFLQHLQRAGVQVYDSTIRLIRQLRDHGFKVAVISASKNCLAVLQAARVEGLFHARVDGVVAAKLHLMGKPAPDLFAEAASRLGTAPTRTVVVEDAIAGVEAGRRGGFGLVIGVDRTGKPHQLLDHGAHVVVADLAEAEVTEDATPPTKNTADLPSALECIDQILNSRARRAAVFTDYDGTLTPIVAHPEDAVLRQQMREIVRRLSHITPVAVISGRDLADVRERVDLEDIIYAGSHGFDIIGPAGLRLERPEAKECLPALDVAEARLREKLSGIPGAQIERKKYSIAIHFRNVAECRLPDIESLVDAMAAQHPNLRKRHGKKVFELQPNVAWHKGRAVLWLLEVLRLDTPDVVPIYLGDDLTDEDAFEALHDRGAGIVVRDEPHPTAARYALENPAEVGSFLALLATQTPPRP
ncbi:MAG TPA: trehalose-phosphatase [Verrucomicrobiota bacterium]|nr:trehalose-phosphatase [Verrucomicrobiota bacterium]HNU51428.1 trehalose-phosphatase [Verrucomicrobiota bacterium]